MSVIMASFINSLQSIAALARLPNQTNADDVREFNVRIFEGKLLFGCILLFLTIFAVRLAFSGKSPNIFSSSRLPPGPRGFPLIGNVLWFLEARRNPSKFAQFVSLTRQQWRIC